MSMSFMKQENGKDERSFGCIKPMLKQYISYFAISMSCQTKPILFAGSINDLLKK